MIGFTEILKEPEFGRRRDHAVFSKQRSWGRLLPPPCAGLTVASAPCTARPCARACASVGAALALLVVGSAGDEKRKVRDGLGEGPNEFGPLPRCIPDLPSWGDPSGGGNAAG